MDNNGITVQCYPGRTAIRDTTGISGYYSKGPGKTKYGYSLFIGRTKVFSGDADECAEYCKICSATFYKAANGNEMIYGKYRIKRDK